MKALTILAAVAVVACLGAMIAPFPELAAYQGHALMGALGAAILVLILVLVSPGGKPAAPAAKAEAAKPVVAPLPANQAEAEVIAFLAALQEKGRFVDFLMDDIAAYGDAQVGAAARVVHAGCKSVIMEHFAIQPVRGESEGSKVTIAAGYHADEYRLIGSIKGEAPFAGTLIHRGWRTERVKLPRIVQKGERLPAIAPAEVELK